MRKNIWGISSWDKGCSFSLCSFSRSSMDAKSVEEAGVHKHC